MSRRATIGFDRRIDLDWLDAAAAQAAAGAPPDALRESLWTFLDGVVSGDASNTARGKTVTVLNHIWGAVPPSALDLRQRAIERLATCTAEERLALHWAMMVGTYPIFSDIASAAGRLLKLQGRFTLAVLSRRLADHWGARSTLLRAVQRIVRSMVQWDVLQDTPTPGYFAGPTGPRGIDSDIGLILIEALLVDAEQACLPLDQLLTHPGLFPFELALTVDQVRAATQFRLYREGLDTDMVELDTECKRMGCD
ncbi:hypothetical protein CCR95_22655 [Thiocystis minor]|uniref:hypothetical protein n=1 Tax=Thiocystis minor TaxID=61597 RepID=UPI0019138F6F|nr:hypothetical protein [Thiocystis minor]MBK5966797.1 hypothetical protein [Thiocystis minor]